MSILGKRFAAVLAATLAFAAAAAVLAGAASSGPQANVTLKLWYLGDPEAPGFQAWMKENAALYHKAHPNVKVVPTLQAVDTWVQSQNIACKGKSGPDIWYQWTGTYALEQAWNGCIVSDEDVWPKSEVAHLTNRAEATWQGKTWWFPQFAQVYPILYNRTLFAKAGLDPNRPPATFAQLTAAGEKLKAGGITPFTLGLKDGWGGEILSVSFVKQVFDNYDQLKRLVISGDFSKDPRWRLWLSKVAQLKPYFNDDVGSLNFADALARFESGRVAMAFGTPGVQNLTRDLRKKHMQVDVMRFPAFTSKRYATSFSTNASGFAITSWSKNKAVAADFIRFMHTPARLAAWFAQTNTFPTDNRWSQAQVKDPIQRKLLGWIAQNNAIYATDFEPVDLDVNGNFPAFQGLLGGNLTVQKAAGIYQNVIEKWRREHRQEIDFFKKWLGSNS